MKDKVNLHRQCKEDVDWFQRELIISVKMVLLLLLFVLFFGIMIFLMIPSPTLI